MSIFSPVCKYVGVGRWFIHMEVIENGFMKVTWAILLCPVDVFIMW